MTEFFSAPILNTPYAPPTRHWELDARRRPTGKIVNTRREAKYTTAVPMAKGSDPGLFAEGDAGKAQKHDPMPIINEIRGIDIFDPRTAEVRSSEPDDLACWFVDTDYNMESFFVRHAYFLGANDPYKNLKRTLKAEIEEEVWLSLKSDTSRPFPKPRSGRIAVKAINHLGDEVMKVIRVDGAQR